MYSLVTLVAHNKDIISAGFYQHRFTLPFSFSQRWPRIGNIPCCAVVPQLITVKRSDMTGWHAGSERLGLAGRNMKVWKGLGALFMS